MYLELLRLVYRLRPGLLPAIAALGLLTAVLETGALTLLAPLMAVLTNTSASLFRWPLDQVVAHFGRTSRADAVLVFAALLAGIMLARFGVIAANYRLIGLAETTLVRHLRLACLDRLFYAPQGFLDRYDNARLLQHFNEQSLRAGEALRTLLKSLAPLATFLFNVGVLLLLSIKLTVVSLLLLGTLAATLTFIPRKIAENSQRFVNALYEYNVKIVDLINGIKTVRSYATYGKERLLTLVLIDRQIEAHKHKIFYSGIIAPLFEVLGYITLCLILILSVFLVEGDGWLAVLAPFAIILARAIPQASVVNSLRSLASLHGPDYESLKRFITPEASATRLPGNALGGFETLRLDNVSFAYTDGQQVLRNVELEVRHGEWVLLVGASGAGKSTLLNLIIGLYEPCDGQVLVNGLDLRNVDLHGWRKMIGIVEQTPFVFNDNVRNNIAYKDMEVTDSEIWKALETVGLAEYIRSLPEQIDTELGDYGTQLSGGQRQRLAFARALCHRPELLILDEPTSALDRETEAEVLEAVRRHYRHNTVIAVSHSESMYRLFDKTYRLEKGQALLEPVPMVVQ